MSSAEAMTALDTPEIGDIEYRDSTPPVEHINCRSLAIIRLCLFAAWLLSMLPFQYFFRLIKHPYAQRFPRFFHRGVCRVLGIHVKTRGQMSKNAPTLYVCNHISYFDIIIMGSLFQGRFVSKAEVGNWPVFGTLARLQNTIFVDRQVRSTANQRDSITQALDEKTNLILFPEGTSSDGNKVLPFKSALFSVAAHHIQGDPEKHVIVQPVSISYAKLDNVPLSRSFRPFFAWFGDMDMAPHAWQAIGMGILNIVVEFHAPVTLEEFGSRKALAKHCQDVIATAVSEELAGRREKI